MTEAVSMIIKPIIKLAFDKAVKGVTKLLLEKKLSINVNMEDVESSISNHITQVSNWSNEVIFKDISKAKSLSQIFIDIDIFLIPQKNMLEGEIIDKISSKVLFNKVDKHIVILGQPGAGKTTLMKFICQSIMLDPNFYPDKFKIPILIRLKDLNSRTYEKNPIVNILFETLGLIVSHGADSKHEDILLVKQRVLISILGDLRSLIILDGYDEISDSKTKERVIEDFKFFALSSNISKIVLTSRSSDFNYALENVEVLEICSLNDEQISDFVSKWLVKDALVSNFLSELKHSPFTDTAMRPLTLAHLCAIYERSGRIPEKPKTIYRKVVNLLLEEWDEQRGIRRMSSYGEFETDRKIEFLSRMAYELTVEYKKSIFSESDLKQIYNSVCFDFGLEKTEVKKVINEVETHTGLILTAGYSKYEFAHKSIQEFLTAEHIVKLPNIPSFEILAQLPNELAIAITISSNPSQYFCELILSYFFPALSRRILYLNRQQRFSKTHGLSGKDIQLDNILFSKEDKSEFISIFINRLVLEKPDFNNSDLVGLAIIVLYTLFKQSEVSQLRMFNPILPVQFESFITLIYKRNKKFNLSLYYDIKSSSFSEENDDKVIAFKRKDYHDRYKGYVLPDTIYVKKMFITDK